MNCKSYISVSAITLLIIFNIVLIAVNTYNYRWQKTTNPSIFNTYYSNHSNFANFSNVATNSNFSNFSNVSYNSDNANFSNLSNHSIHSSFSNFSNHADHSNYSITSNTANHANFANFSNFANVSKYSNFSNFSNQSSNSDDANFSISSNYSLYASFSHFSDHANYSDFSNTSNTAKHANFANFSNFANVSNHSNFSQSSNVSYYSENANFSNLSNYSLNSSFSNFSDHASHSNFSTSSNMANHATWANFSDFANVTKFANFANYPLNSSSTTSQDHINDTIETGNTTPKTTDYCFIKSCAALMHTMCQYEHASNQRVKLIDGLTESQKELIIKQHNSVNDSHVTNGTRPQYIWDATLAEFAQKWANQMFFGLDDCRNTEESKVFQNVALFMRNDKQPIDTTTFEYLIDGFRKEKETTEEELEEGQSVIAEYYLDKAKGTISIGCGFVMYIDSFNELYVHYLVCNYIENAALH